MPETEISPLNIICLATYFKGADFIRECKAHGCRVILITKEKVLKEDWPRESLDDLLRSKRCWTSAFHRPAGVSRAPDEDRSSGGARGV
jgi:hypothetical protein